MEDSSAGNGTAEDRPHPPVESEAADRKDVPDSRLSSSSSLIALVLGAVGATLEAAALVAFLARGGELPDQATYLVVADLLVAILAVAGAGLTIKSPQTGAIALAGAGIASFMSDMVGLSTPPRMIPGGMMILSAVITFALRKEHSTLPAASANQPQWLPVLVTIALGLHVVGVGFIGLGAGLVAPPLGVLFGWLMWAVILFAGLRLRRSRPWLAVATPFVGVGAWIALLTFGGAVLGWTA